MDEQSQKTLKEILPDLDQHQRTKLGVVLREATFVKAVGKRTEDGNKVRTYPCYHYKYIKAVSEKIFGNG